MPIYDEEYWMEQEVYHKMCEQEYERQQAEYYFAIYQQEERIKYPLFFWRENI